MQGYKANSLFVAVQGASVRLHFPLSSSLTVTLSVADVKTFTISCRNSIKNRLLICGCDAFYLCGFFCEHSLSTWHQAEDRNVATLTESSQSRANVTEILPSPTKH